MSYLPSAPILVVDDDVETLRAVEAALVAAGLGDVACVADADQVMAHLAGKPRELVLLDLLMPNVDGRELLDRIVTTYPGLPVIVISGVNEVATAVACIRRGAYDYLLKPLAADQLVGAVRRAIEVHELRQENRALGRGVMHAELEHPEAFAGIVTGDAALRAALRYVELVASSSQPVLVTGETGTGKELVAGAIHRLSGRRGEFVAVNVAGLDEATFADTLFGHRKGAYTGADDPRSGLVQRAEEGTLFLDEIGDLAVPSQVKLLRLLQEREYLPLGSDRPRTSTARVVVATHQDLGERCDQGRLRRDLYYRLCTHRVHLPPLRERHSDLELLVEHFLDQAAAEVRKPRASAGHDFIELLRAYSFPGNVRELRALVLDAVARGEGRTVSLDGVRELVGRRAAGERMRSPTPPDEGSDARLVAFAARLPSLKQVQDLLVVEAMRRAGGNQALAATILGVTRQALNKRLRHPRPQAGASGGKGDG